MEDSSTRPHLRVRRRAVLQSAAAVAAAGPAMLNLARPAIAEAAGGGGAMYAYVGCFTTAKRKAHGNGINVYRMNPHSGAWTHVQLLPNIVNPSFFAIDRGQRFLYSVHADLDEVSAYAIDPKNGQLKPLNRQNCGGNNPVFLTIDPTGRYIVTANYTGGSVGVVAIEKDGSLGARTDVVALSGTPGPVCKRQAGSHPHDCPFDPAGRFITVPDLGLDRISVFRLDTGTGKLVADNPPSVATRSGAGPRHIAFHPKLPYAYVINELGSTMTTYRYDAARGVLHPVQVWPTTPPSFTGDNSGAEVAVAPSGRFVYGSNRGQNSIVTFAVDSTRGTLHPLGWQSTEGETPRFFTLDPSGSLLYACNRDSDTVVTFRVNTENGRLMPTGQVVKVGNPCTIVFARFA